MDTINPEWIRSYEPKTSYEHLVYKTEFGEFQLSHRPAHCDRGRLMLWTPNSIPKTDREKMHPLWNVVDNQYYFNANNALQDIKALIEIRKESPDKGFAYPAIKKVSKVSVIRTSDFSFLVQKILEPLPFYELDIYLTNAAYDVDIQDRFPRWYLSEKSVIDEYERFCHCRNVNITDIQEIISKTHIPTPAS